MELILNGIITGIGLSILVGPILIAIIEQSLRYGRPAGLSLASGIWLSDLFYMVICYYSFDWIRGWSSNRSIMLSLGLLGAIILLGMGIYNIRSYRSVVSPDGVVAPPKKGVKRLAALKGFSLNLFNPFTVGFWITISLVFSHNNHQAEDKFLIYGGVMIGTIIIIDLLKVFLADYLRPKLEPKNLALIKRITGYVFIAFSAGILVLSYQKFG